MTGVSRPPAPKIFCPGPTPPRPKQPVIKGTGKKVVYSYSSILRKGAWGYCVAATVPPHRKYFCPGSTSPRPKQPVVWGTGKNVVYGYSSIQRKGAWRYSVAATVPPPHRKYFCLGTNHQSSGSGPLFDGGTEPAHQTPSSVWFCNHFPISVAWGFWTTFRWGRVDAIQQQGMIALTILDCRASQPPFEIIPAILDWRVSQPPF